jgi:hypothetical protein
LLELDPASQAELEAIGDEALTRIVARVCADPSGQHEPRHSYTRKFRNASKYANVGNRDVWEFCPSKWRGMFMIASGKRGGRIYFLEIKGTRFMTLGECPWHKGK